MLAASAPFSPGEVGPSGSSGSAKTRARRISASVGSAENTGMFAGGETGGTVRFTVIARGADCAAGGACWLLLCSAIVAVARAPSNTATRRRAAASPRAVTPGRFLRRMDPRLLLRTLVTERVTEPRNIHMASL